MCLEFETPVRGVREEGVVDDFAGGVRGVRNDTTPYLATEGTLVIPFGSPERYHWWKGGQSIKQTREELVSAHS
jgi:hypothetical protein